MKGLVLSLAALAAGLLLPGAAQASPDAALAFAPPSATVAAGATTAVDITVADIPSDPGLGGYALTLAFDPAVVRLDSLADAGFVTGSANDVQCAVPQIDNTAGKATAGCVTIPGLTQPGVWTAAPVPLLHASFAAVAPGTSSLSLVGSVLLTPSSSAIPVTLAAGSVAVTGASSTAAPATATVTATPAVAGTLTPTPPAATPSTPAVTAVATLPPEAIEGVVGTVLAGLGGQPKVPNTGAGSGGGSGLPLGWIIAGAVAAGVLATASIGIWRRVRRSGLKP